MGTIHHHSFIIQGATADVQVAHAKAVELFHELTTPTMETPVNLGLSFAVLPDGSKELWPESDEYDKRRAIFKGWLREAYIHNTCLVSWVELSFGELGTRICDTNQAWAERDKKSENDV
jgi:hypothetical protein